jgi:hypothetical protein
MSDKHTDKLFHQMGAVATLVADALDDEGDRVFLGSTNHKEMLEKIKDLYFQWRFDHGTDGPDDILETLDEG